MISTQYKVLYPVDFSKRSMLAARHVKVWVEHLRAALDTLHIVKTNAQPYNELSQRLARCTADLKYFSDHYFGRCGARSVVLNGEAAGQIQHFADHEMVDLVMLPRNHQSGLARIFYDSLTATLLERCRASVWMTEHLDKEASSSVSNVLCALQFGQDATLDAQNQRIFYAVQRLMSSFQAGVTFLHVTGDNNPSDSSSELQTNAGPGQWLAQARDLFGSSIRLLSTSGNVIAGIRDTASRIGADLIVVGRVRPGSISLGRQSRLLKIDHSVRCPVLSVW
jgi:nucleotide-binding universal stress UspA family protein